MNKMPVLNDKECVVCHAYFLEHDISESGLCKRCTGLGYKPGQKIEQDHVKMKKNEEIRTIVREEIEKILREKEEESRENAGNFTPKICKICGKEFVPRAPAMQRCDECIAESKK